MPLTIFDHVNILTSNVEGMTAWYRDVLGLKVGWRPDFDVGGTWLYLGDQALVHLVETDKPPHAGGRIEHFAFGADDLDGFRATLATHNVEVRDAPVPGTNILQLNFHDPDGNHIHVDFRV